MAKNRNIIEREKSSGIILAQNLVKTMQTLKRSEVYM